MEGYCSTGQSLQRAVVPVEEEEDVAVRFIPLALKTTNYVSKVCIFSIKQ
jgi:hypothetical protein